MTEHHDEQSPEPLQPVISVANSTRWIKGFIQIIHRPWDLNALQGANVYKIYISAALIISFSFTVASWLSFMHPQLREQALYCLNYIPLMAGQAPLPAAQSFQFTQILATTLIQQGIVGLAVISAVMWMIHRVFTNEPLRFLAVLGIMSYASIIASFGFIATSAVQVATASLGSSFSLAGFLPFRDYPFLNGYLAKFDLFLVWQYCAAGIAIASFMGIKRSAGLGFALLTLVIHAAFSGMLTYYSFQLLMQAKH